VHACVCVRAGACMHVCVLSAHTMREGRKGKGIAVPNQERGNRTFSVRADR